MKNDTFSPGFADVPVKDFSVALMAVQAERDSLIKKLFQACLEVNNACGPVLATVQVVGVPTLRGGYVTASISDGEEDIAVMMGGPGLKYPGVPTRLDSTDIHDAGYRLSVEEANNRSLQGMITLMEGCQLLPVGEPPHFKRWANGLFSV